jgi:predicted alpha/beta hydrolase family esterase
MMHTLLIMAGLGDSSEGHWQNNWLKQFPNAQKVIQNNWNQPELEDWISNLNKAIEKIEGPIVLVAHSLAVVLVAHWSKKYDTSKIAGALLVAPADVDSQEHTPQEIWNFAPIPITKLLFPSILITSDDDPYIDTTRAQFLAEKWQSLYYNVGNKGHINAASNLGEWQEGQEILESLLKLIKETT